MLLTRGCPKLAAVAVALLPTGSVAGFGCRSLHYRASIRGLSVLRGGSPSSSGYYRALHQVNLPESFEERREDVTAALLAVLHASRVTRYLQPISSSDIQTLSKKDASPVTIGDFASQALALQVLHNNFSNRDMYIAEEGSDALRKDNDLLENVLEAVNNVQENALSRQDLLEAIDYGQGIDEQNDPSPDMISQRIWCLDPIDGTKGFLRGRVKGGQYCIALALIEDGEPVVSVLGCPNLPLPNTESTRTTPYGVWSENEAKDAEATNSLFSNFRGCLFVAVKGGGCYEIPIHVLDSLLTDRKSTNVKAVEWKRLQVTANDGSDKATHDATFCLGVERGFSDPKGTVLMIAQLIHGQDALPN